jgi:hypothetical protein
MFYQLQDVISVVSRHRLHRSCPITGLTLDHRLQPFPILFTNYDSSFFFYVLNRLFPTTAKCYAYAFFPVETGCEVGWPITGKTSTGTKTGTTAGRWGAEESDKRGMRGWAGNMNTRRQGRGTTDPQHPSPPLQTARRVDNGVPTDCRAGGSQELSHDYPAPLTAATSNDSRVDRRC